MPLSRATAERLARQVAELFAEAQTKMLEVIARRVGADIHDPYWAEKKLAQMREYERQMRALIADLQAQAESGVRTALTEAHARGGLAAVADVRRAGGTGAAPVEPFAGINAVEQYVRATMGPLAATQQRTLITTLNAYQNAIAAGSLAASRAEAVAGGVAQVLTGTGTRLQATQQVLDQFARSGVTGFVDRAGRAWSLDSYAEMAVRAGTMDAALAGHLDTLQANGFDLVIVSEDSSPCPECLVPGTLVEGPIPQRRLRREHMGDVLSVTTAGRKNVVGTEDHTVLTPLGWRRLKDLHPGDEVISQSGDEGVRAVIPDCVQVPAVVEQVGQLWAPLFLAGPVRHQFHGHGSYCEVRVVAPDGRLLREDDIPFAQPLRKPGLIDGVGAAASGLRGRVLAPRLIRLVGATHGVMRGFQQLAALLFAQSGPLLAQSDGVLSASLGRGVAPFVGNDASRFRVGARGNASAPKVVGNNPAADSEGGAELLRALSGKVAPDKIVSIERRQFRGHVWDLQTGPHWYVANGIISHNCVDWEGKVLSILPGDPEHDSVDDATGAGLFHPGCRHDLSLYQEGFTPPYPEKTDAELEQQAQAYKDSQTLRRYEREVRAAKREQVVQLTPEGRAAAQARVRALQARIREHVDATGAIRRRAREQITRSAGRAI